MLACIPTNDNTGREASVCGHFGSAAFFTLYDTETDEIKVLDNRNAHHAHGTCHPLSQLATYRIDCVVCRGMGRRAIEALNAGGIKTYQYTGKKVSEILLALKEDRLAEMDPTKACRGHGRQTEPFAGSPMNCHGQGAGMGQGRGRNARRSQGSGSGSGGGRSQQ